jgi:polysaccharide export outer membrane protein
LQATPQETSISPTIGIQAEIEAAKLTRLWQERTQSVRSDDYPLGPGDVLEITVTNLPEITNHTVRVTGTGSITLPLIGSLTVSGRTEAEVHEEIRQRLAAEYMHNPQVNIFVREYHSRQVAVLGAVEKPGLYNLASDGQTMLDLISLAGGITKDAAPRLQFIPAEPVERQTLREVTATLPAGVLQQVPSPLLLKRTDPILVDLKELTTATHQLSASLPLRPGDVILVPGAGDVLIEGWVEKPGTYKLTPGLTVLKALAAAGGSLFAADTTAVRIMRTDASGHKTTETANVDDIKNGKTPDVPLQEGDLIEVTASTAKMVPYGMYRLFTTIIHVGGSVPLF